MTLEAPIPLDPGPQNVGALLLQLNELRRQINAITMSQVSGQPFVVPSNLAGDGVWDDGPAIQEALDDNPGATIWLPRPSVYYRITTPLEPLDNQRIIGEGNGSEIRQVTSLASVIEVTAKTSVVIENLIVYCIGDRVSQISGAGILLSGGSSQCRITGNTFKNCRGGAVTVSNSDDNEVSFNTFLDAAVSGATHETDVGWDVQILNASSRNLIANNLCISGTGTGIKVQSVNDGEIAEDNVIIGNRVANNLVYGIIAYRNYNGAPPAPQSIRRTIIANNNIYNTLGNLLNTATGDYAYGAGIYIQGAEDAVVVGNSIDLSHSGAVVFSSSLAPGGIGSANMSRGTIIGNSITNSGVNGIDISNAFPTKGDPHGALVINGNIILDSALRGIRARNTSDISITDNVINVAGSSAVEVNLALTFAMTNYVISGNRLSNAASSGINVKYVSNVQIVGNLLETITGSAISVEQGSDFTITDNLIKDHGGVGIAVDATIAGALVAGNSVVGTGSSSEGIRLAGKATLGQNRVTGNVQNWTGDYAVLRGTASTTAIGNVGAGEDDLRTYVLPASSMVQQGDNLFIRGWGNTANNANVKTLKLYFGTTAIMTATLTVSQISNWEVDAYVLRGPSANAQRAVVKLTQGGAVTQISITETTLTETEANALTARFTATATADNDIQQFGIITTFQSPGGA